MVTLIKWFLIFDKRYFFAWITLFYVLFNLIINEFIITNEFYYNSLGEQLSIERIDEILNLKQKWNWITYLFIPVTLLIKYSLIAFCLDVGAVISGYRISFKKLFQVVMIADLVFLLAQLLRTIILWITDINSLTEIQYFLPFSLLSLFDVKELDVWFIYPLQVINVFEIVYWFILALGLKIVFEKKFSKMFRLVLSSYGTGLVIWIMVVMFLSINFS